MSEKRAFTRTQKAEQAKRAEAQQETLALQHEIFFQLMKVPQFTKWFEQNIRVSHDIDQEEHTIQVQVHYVGEEGDPEQNIVKCPGCQLKFDANIEAKLVALATGPLPEPPPEV